MYAVAAPRDRRGGSGGGIMGPSHAQILLPTPSVTAGPCGKEAGAGGAGWLVSLKLRLCGALLPRNISSVREFELVL